MTKEEVFNLCAYTKNGVNLQERVFKKKFNDAYLEIQEIKFPENFTFVQKLYHYLHDDIELTHGFCPECGKRCGFISLRNGYHIYCSNYCERHSRITKEKREQTTLERYGVANAFMNEEIKEKIKRTNRLKLGVDYPGKNEKVKEKIRRSKRKKYGDEFFTNREKSKSTYTKHRAEYGESWVKGIQEKTKTTNRARYGTDYATQNAGIRKKIKDTNLKKYGVENYIELPEVRLKSRENQKNNNGQSILENSVFEYIKTIYKSTIVKNDRHTLDGKEIDILLPEINVGFEINGDFWHMNPEFHKASDVNYKLGKRAKEIWHYDSMKIKAAMSKNITVFVIWESDWKRDKSGVKSKIKEIINHSRDTSTSDLEN